MLVKVYNTEIIAFTNISNKKKEDEFLSANPNYIRTDFKFAESLDLYEYDGTNFTLTAGYEIAKQEQIVASLAISNPIDLQKAKDDKCALIDEATGKAIVAIAGDEAKQRNQIAKYSQMALKKALGTITPVEETEILNPLDALYAAIETLVNDGNAKEASVQAIEMFDVDENVLLTFDEAVVAVKAIVV